VRVSILVLVACASQPPAARPQSDPRVDRVRANQVIVEQFFGGTLQPYAVEVVPTHAAFEAYAKQRWGVPELPCFAVAMGTGSTLVLLEPTTWATEACDHANDTPEDVDRVIVHELVHVFHGQQRPSDRELERADEVGWFVEGLATYASGQLTPAREQQVRETAPPAQLADAWSGKARYAISGTIVRYIDRRYGRAMLLELLPLSKNAEILAKLGLTEAELLAGSSSDSRR
jgi:hypothetical protein